jgi:Tfp pilus assembly protein PilV
MMLRTKGFSFIEILVSLLLITATSLALLRQQWQFSQVLNQKLREFEILTDCENSKEQQFRIRAEQ